MITYLDYEFIPKYTQWLYIPDETILRTKQLALWYAYLNWRIGIEGLPKKEGMLESVEYVFPLEEFPFRFRNNFFKFCPDFRIEFKSNRNPEYQTLSPIRGNQGKMLRAMKSHYPRLSLRVIEIVEFKQIMENLEGVVELLKEVKRVE